MAKVNILLACYNGASFIKTQILSIISQSFTDWRLIIHDDGSTDDSLSIIKQCLILDDRITFVDDDIKCNGAAANFMHLLKYANAEYVMFADQDDIWFDNKIEVMYKAIKSKNNRIPQVAYSNSYIWMPEGGIKGLATLTFPARTEQFLFLNSGMQGCVAIFNYRMLQYLKQWNEKVAMHDHLLHLLGLTIGQVTYIHLPLMLYRNHDKNATGFTATSSMDLIRIAQNNMLPVVSKDHYDTVSHFYNIWHKEIHHRDLRSIKIYLRMPHKGFTWRVIVILVCGFQLFNSRFRLLLKLLIRPYIN